MNENFEQSLRRAMVALGRAVEGVIGKAKRAKVQVGSRGGVQPILSLESQLPTTRIRDLIDASVNRMLGEVIPDIHGGRALEVGEGPASHGPRLMSAQAGTAVGVEIGGGSLGRQGDVSRGYVVRADAGRLPFADGMFTYVLGRLATTLQGDVVRNMREIARVMAPGGQGLIIDFHPYGLYAKRGHERLRPVDTAVRSFEDYYRVCKMSGVRVVDMREIFIDEVMRKLFREEEIGAYRSLKGSPLLAFVFVYKPRGKG